MKRLRRAAGQIGIFFFCVLLPGYAALAANGPKAMETYTGESEISIYVKGLGEEPESVAVQIGADACDSVEIGTLSSSPYPMDTLIMLDNAKSVPKDRRAQISEILQNLISDRGEQERIAIATCAKEMDYVADYTSDYTVLKAAIDGISYQKSTGSLADILYEALSDGFVPQQEDVYRRVLIISDGIDSSSAGYTWEELNSLVTGNPIPIYTIGVTVDGKEEQLDKLFAISRLSNAEHFLLDELTDNLEVNYALNRDRDIVRFAVSLEKEWMDGSRKVVKLTFPSGESLSVEVLMPQPLPEAAAGSLGTDILWPILAAAGGFAAAVILFAVLRHGKKKKEGTSSGGEQEKPGEEGPEAGHPVRRGTEVIGNPQGGGGSDTSVIWEDTDDSCRVILTDVRSPARSFQASIGEQIVIGYEKGDIILDYDTAISDEHCKILARDGKFYIEDLNSTNGTYVNHRRITSEAEIFPGDVIKLGRQEFKFETAR